LCRSAQDNCDKPEFCNGDGLVCPSDETAVDYSILWDLEGSALKIFLPVCNNDSNAAPDWLTISYLRIEEVGDAESGNSSRLDNWPFVDYLDLQSYTLRTTTFPEAQQSEQSFEYDNVPLNITEYSTGIAVDGARSTLSLNLFYFDKDTLMRWKTSVTEDCTRW